jgi:hypothetical protein
MKNGQGLINGLPGMCRMSPPGRIGFRRVYATMIAGWRGLRDTRPLLNGDFEPFEMFV